MWSDKNQVQEVDWLMLIDLLIDWLMLIDVDWLMWSVKNHVQEVKETQEQGFGDKEQYVSFQFWTEIQFFHQGGFVAEKDCFGLVAFNFSCIGSVETWLFHGPM